VKRAMKTGMAEQMSDAAIAEELEQKKNELEYIQDRITRLENEQYRRKQAAKKAVKECDA